MGNLVVQIWEGGSLVSGLAQMMEAWLFSPGVGGGVEPWALGMGFSPS